MDRVESLLAQKGGRVLAAPSSDTVLDAIRTMVEHNVGSILVVDAGRVVGIFTERDYLRRIVLQGRTSRETRLADVMTHPLVFVSPDTPIEECLALMTGQHIRHLPVMRGDELVGVVSVGDVVKHLNGARTAEIRYLHDYIAGKYPG